MKFILLSILALVAFAVAAEGRQLDIAEDLKIRWHMDEPNVTYFSENNMNKSKVLVNQFKQIVNQ